LKEVVVMTPNTHHNSPLLTSEAFAALGAPALVYVRPIKAAEILAEVPESVEDFNLSPDHAMAWLARG
jgi:hypothetical protein